MAKKQTTNKPAEKAEEIKTEYVRKLGTQTLKDLPIGEKAVLGGICRGYQVGTSTYGDYVAFKGDFEMTFEGHRLRAPKCFLPEVGENLLREAVENQVMEGDESPQVAFAIEIIKSPIEKKTKDDRGYEWRISPLIESVSPSPLQLALGVEK